MKRINWPFSTIVMIVLIAVVNGAFLWDQYWIPAQVRHHLTDFGAVAFLTTIVSSVINLLTPVNFRHKHPAGLAITHRAVPVLAAVHWTRVELEDLMGVEDEGFDPGTWVDEFLGRPNESFFDWWDVTAVLLGGIVVFYLQWLSTRRISTWGRIPLWYYAE